MARPRIAEEVSATFVVNLPELGYEAHVKRIQTLLGHHGYRATAMTGELILKFADQITSEMTDREQAARLLTNAAQNRPTTDGDAA
jgi:hypothetical protein